MARALTLAAGAILLVLMLAVLLLLLSILNRVSGVGDVGAGASRSAATAVSGAAQAARDVFDPTHPPRGTLTLDPEIDEFRRVDAGGVVAPHPDRDITLSAVRQRAGAENADTAQYAVIDDRLKTPKETRVLGVVVSRNFDAHEHLLYKGQLFQVTRRLYKVNWVSYETQQIGVVRLRSSDGVIGELAFSVD